MRRQVIELAHCLASGRGGRKSFCLAPQNAGANYEADGVAAAVSGIQETPKWFQQYLDQGLSGNLHHACQPAAIGSQGNRGDRDFGIEN